MMEYEGLLFLVIVLMVLAAQAAWKLWQRSSSTSREALHLQREAWLTRFEGNGSAITSEPGPTLASAAAPKLLRRRKPAAVWAAEAEEGPKVKSDSPVASAGSLIEPPASSEVVPLSEDLSKIPGSATALETGEATVPADEPDEPDLTVLTPRSTSDEGPSVESDLEQQPEVQVQEEPQEEEQVAARRSISETLRAASAEEEPTERTFDELLDHVEASLMQVELCQDHAVLLKRAELHLLTLLGGLRDLLMRSLRSQSRQRTMELVGCARASRLRAVLESLHLSPGRADDRLSSCRAVCDAVDAVLADFGLQEIHELRAESRSLRYGLCEARELCGFQFRPQWRVQVSSLAPPEHWQQLHKDLFGLEQGIGRGLARNCLQLLLALTCPNPFAQEPQKLTLALESLQPHLEDDRLGAA